MTALTPIQGPGGNMTQATGTICYFVPPYVEAELAANDDVPTVDQAHLDVSGDVRERRAKAITGVAPAELAPPATGTSRREVYDSGNTTNQRVKLVRPEGSPETKD